MAAGRSPVGRLTLARGCDSPTEAESVLFPARDQIVAVNHFGAAAETENGGEIRRCPASDLLRVFHVVSAQAAADLRAVGSADDHRVAASKATFDLYDADRQ